jgi:hypothetical protein
MRKKLLQERAQESTSHGAREEVIVLVDEAFATIACSANDLKK